MLSRALVALWLMGAAQVQAASFDVSPVTVTLTDKAKSAIVTVTNRSAESLRFHISAFAWTQKTDGEMVLTETKEIVFFPALMTLKPGEARNLRVGVTRPAGNIEKTYRVFVQELPPAVKSPDDKEGTVRMLTKMGIPVFHQGKSPSGVASIEGLTMRARSVRFDLKNKGNAHYRAQKVTLLAKAGDKVVHKKELDGWYVLAGGTRVYTVELPEAACAGLSSIEVQVASDVGVTKAALANAKCGH